MTLRTIRTAMALTCAMAVAILPAPSAHADSVRDSQWHLRYLKVAEAHKISQGKGVTVAVIDSGVDPHPDLRGNLLPGTDTSSAGKSEGRTDSDPRGHGTGMAGLVAAHGRGSSGALGIAPEAKILPVRYRKDIQGDSDSIARGINVAVEKGAGVISISAVGGASPMLRKAVETAIRSNVVVVAAAGNKSQDAIIGFPAAYEGVVAVGATDRNGRRDEISITGREITLLAPGVEIRTTGAKGRYSVASGTSNSAAIVSGAVALIRSKYPDLSAEEVVHRLTATAVDKGEPGRDDEYGYGVLDLVAALTADVPPLEGATPNASPSTAPSPTGSGSALPDTENAGSNTTLLTALAVLILLAVTGLVFWLVRRRNATGQP